MVKWAATGSNPTPDVPSQSPLGLRVGNLGTSGPRLPIAPQCNMYRDPDLGMLAARQVPSSRHGETQSPAKSSRLKARTSESSPPQARQARLFPAARGPGSTRNAARSLSMVLAPAEGSQGLPGRRRFRSRQWRERLEAGSGAKACLRSARPRRAPPPWRNSAAGRRSCAAGSCRPSCLSSSYPSLSPAPGEGRGAGVAPFSSARPHPPPEPSRFSVGERDGAARGRGASGDRASESQGLPGLGLLRLADVSCSVTVGVGVGVGVAFSPFLCAVKVFCTRHVQLSVNTFARESGEARTRTRAVRRALVLSWMRPRGRP